MCPRRSLRHAFRSAPAVLAAAGATFIPARASADEGCHVELASDAPRAWQDAVRSLETTIAQGGTAIDCERIVLRVEGKRARVSYWTTDGRGAERLIGAPNELAATVSALGAMIPIAEPAAAPPASPPEREPPEPPRPVFADRASASPETKTPGTTTADVVYGVLAGGRAGAGGLVSAVFDLYAAMGLQHWQLGILGRIEPRYANVFDAEAQPRSASFGAGVTFGRRAPIGANALLVAGGSLLIAAVHEDRASKNESNNTRADPRFGGYLGIVLPRRSNARFRANLTADVTPPDIIEHSAEGLALTPWWAAALTMGLELGGP